METVMLLNPSEFFSNPKSLSSNQPTKAYASSTSSSCTCKSNNDHTKPPLSPTRPTDRHHHEQDPETAESFFSVNPSLAMEEVRLYWNKGVFSGFFHSETGTNLAATANNECKRPPALLESTTNDDSSSIETLFSDDEEDNVQTGWSTDETKHQKDPENETEDEDEDDELLGLNLLTTVEDGDLWDKDQMERFDSPPL